MSLANIGAGIGIGTSVLDFADRNRRENHEAHEARMAASREAERQREFAQNGVRWKVEDARRAGISPLAALGAQTTSYQSQHVETPQRSQTALSEMGQDISRSLAATSTQQERQMQQLQVQSATLDVEGKGLDNQIRATQLQKLRSTGPAFPSSYPNAMDGQGDSLGVVVKPSESIASSRGNPGVQAGAINSVQYARDADGNLSVVPSEQMKERIEDDFVGETMWHLRNRLNPPAPSEREMAIPKSFRDKGYKYWFWHPLRQQFIPSKNP